MSIGWKRIAMASALCASAALAAPNPAMAKAKDKKKPDFPKWKDVSEGYKKVVSTADGKSMFDLYKREKDEQMLAVLPRNPEGQLYFFRMTVASGNVWAGYAGATRYAYWKRFDKRLALVTPNFATRTSGDLESQSSVGRHFTDRVLLDVPIVSMAPGGRPVIDLDSLFVKRAGKFFGPMASRIQGRLATIAKAKAFPDNIEVSFEVPGPSGQMMELAYSVSEIPERTGYTPREADTRVGYFTTTYRDLGIYGDESKWKRYINRWHLEKAAPNLKLSPPKNPIVFYVEHTVPIRYRRWVREGIEYWNEAFEKVGFKDAIEVRYQDKATGAHMDKDPENVNHNFIMWLSNDISTAIGPSRVHPKTGQILDADIVLTDGWIRAFHNWMENFVPEIATDGFSAETLAWLEDHPSWDPRLRLLPPSKREELRAIQQQTERDGRTPILGGFAAANVDPTLFGDDQYDGLFDMTQTNGLCMAAHGKAIDMATMHIAMTVLDVIGEDADDDDEGENGEKEEKEQMIDGIPESFIGPLLADLVAHEVGHTIGLRHNFKASSVYTMEEINSPELKGKKPWSTSVMDYHPLNVNAEAGEVQGDWAPIGVGEYDMWAIAYGYTLDKKPEKVLERVSEEMLPYATDEDTAGPDPLARRYDLSADPHEYAKVQMRLIEKLRGSLLDEYVEDGDSWAKARRGYEVTLGQQIRAISMMANWVGGAHVYRDKKGDPGARTPIDVVDADKQREALEFVIKTAFRDKAYGLTPELLNHMTVDKWLGGGGGGFFDDPTWEVHDRILGVQASALTMLMNPTTLRRVFDNEAQVAEDEETLTLPELINTVSDEVWSEIAGSIDDTYDAQDPMISNLRRNLQREHLQRLIDLALDDTTGGAASSTIRTLSTHKLREIAARITEITESRNARKLDPYTTAHLSESGLRIKKALDADYIYNSSDFAGGGSTTIILGREEQQQD